MGVSYVVPTILAEEAGGKVDADHAAGFTDCSQLTVDKISRMRAQGMRIEQCVATRGALLIAATSPQKPRSLRCERSIKIPKRLQAPISSLAELRQTRSPYRAKRDNRSTAAPCPNALGRLQTRPERAKSRLIQYVQELEIRVRSLPGVFDMEGDGC